MIAELLHEGADHPQTACDLSRLLGMDPRDITRAIEQERKEGLLICATSRGYFLARDPQEARQYARRLSRRIGSITKTRDALAAAIEEG